MPASLSRYSITFLGLFFAFTIQCPAQLERALEVHGGRAKWQGFASVEYDVSWASPKGARVDHQVFDLRTRAGLITSDKYTLGVENGQVWIRPGLDALDGTPPRFYMWTPFYFFSMPFVFSDPGASVESLGTKTVGGREYNAVKITFRKGTGDTPDDFMSPILIRNPASSNSPLTWSRFRRCEKAAWSNSLSNMRLFSRNGSRRTDSWFPRAGRFTSG